MKRIVLTCLAIFFFLPASVMAEVAPNAVIVLNYIKLIHTQEHAGDELYIDLGLFGTNQMRQYARIPHAPLYWPSDKLSELKDLQLWSGVVSPDQTLHLEVSLIETDSSMFNPDDLLGTVRISLSNHQGIITAQWSMPNHPNGPQEFPTTSTGPQTFILTDGLGKYEVGLSFKRP